MTKRVKIISKGSKFYGYTGTLISKYYDIKNYDCFAVVKLDATDKEIRYSYKSIEVLNEKEPIVDKEKKLALIYTECDVSDDFIEAKDKTLDLFFETGLSYPASFYDAHYFTKEELLQEVSQVLSDTGDNRVYVVFGYELYVVEQSITMEKV